MNIVIFIGLSVLLLVLYSIFGRKKKPLLRKRRKYTTKFPHIPFASLLSILALTIMVVAAIAPRVFANILPAQFEVIHIFPTKVNTTAGEQIIYALVNQERINHGLQPLIWNPTLALYSRKHSADMAFSHNVYHNKQELLTLQVGENALMMPKSYGGFGLLPYFYLNFYRDSNTLWKDSVQAWMNSSSHKANILATSYTQTGIGIAIASDGVTFYITQDFR